MRPLPTDLSRVIADGGHGLGVLVIRLGAFGDIVRTLPAARLLRRALPAARLHWVVDDRWTVALDGHPDLSGLVVLPRRRWREAGRSPLGWPALLASIAAFRAELRALRPDLVVDFHGNLRSGIVGRLSGARVRLGYSGHQQKEVNRWFTTHRVDPGSRRASRIERNLALVRALGLPDGPLPVGDLPLAAAGAGRAAEIVRDLGATAYAVVSPGASRAQADKKPPANLLAAACRTLASRGLQVLVVWGPGEQPDARRVVERSSGAARLAPPTDLAALAGLIAGARLFVGGDSGPLHLACAVGCPVIGLYGPTDPAVNTPWGVPHRAVSPAGRVYTGVKRNDRRAGFAGLEADRVERAIVELLELPRQLGP